MRVFWNKNCMIHWTYGASTIIIARASQIGWRRSMPSDDLLYRQRNREPFVKCSLSHSQKWVHWLWHLKTASWQLKWTLWISQAMSCFRETSILFFWVGGHNTPNKLNEGHWVFAGVWIWVISCGISEISFLPEWRLWQSFVHPTWLAWPFFKTVNTPGCCVPQLVILKMISARHINSTPRFCLCRAPVPRKVPKILTSHRRTQFELCCPHCQIWT